MISRYFGPFIQSFCPASPLTISYNSLFSLWTNLNFYFKSIFFLFEIEHLLLQFKKKKNANVLQEFEKQRDLNNSSTHWKHQVINHSRITAGYLAKYSQVWFQLFFFLVFLLPLLVIHPHQFPKFPRTWGTCTSCPSSGELVRDWSTEQTDAFTSALSHLKWTCLEKILNKILTGYS